ncbi:unnamed protein product [Peniophora sp. CBMAI 1063]|nr:unnamed protein product [Peniophora sp. CBMAI 1063]
MVGQADRKILWHPRGENKFVVGGGSQVTLYEWSDEPSIVQLASQHDLSLMKCFAWSPDAHIDDLLAVGLTSGRVELLRLESSRRGTDHIAARGPHAHLAPKSSRACTSLAFCPAAPNLLAVGLDKVRSDASLVLWDIASTTPALGVSFANNTGGDTRISAPPPSPVRSSAPLPPPISRKPSAASSTNTPSAPFALPRHDSFTPSTRADTRILQTHAPTETVHALAWLPGSPHILAAALSSRWLRLFDVRAPKDAAPAHPVGRITALATDVFDPWRLAAAADGAVSVWDVRRMGGVVVAFTARDAAGDCVPTFTSGSASPMGQGASQTQSPITSLEFSSSKRGLLATLERDAPCVRLWDIVRTSSSPSSSSSSALNNATRDRDPMTRQPKVSWTSGAASMLPWAAGGGGGGGGGSGGSGGGTTPPHTEPGSPAGGVGYSLVLADTRKSKRFRGALSSFALVPSPPPPSSTSPSSRPISTITTILGTTKDGDLELSTLPHIPPHTHFSPRGHFSLSTGTGLRVFSGVQPTEDVPDHPWSFVDGVENDEPVHRDAELRERGRSGRRAATRERDEEGSKALFGRGDEDGFPALVSPKRLPSPGLPPYIKRNALVQSRATSEQPRLAGKPDLPLPPAASTSTSTLLKPPPMLVTAADSTDPSQSQESVGAGRGKEGSGSRVRGGRRARRRAVERVHSLVCEDVSMVARSRALAGYGLGNPTHNASLFPVGADTDSTMLRVAWTWAAHARRRPALVGGYDFRSAGLLALWEGFPPTVPSTSTSTSTLPALPHHLDASHTQSPTRSRSKRGRHRATDDPPAEFTAALLSRHPPLSLEPGWRPAKIMTSPAHLVSRRAGLDMLGWSLDPDDVEAALRRWEADGQISRAATWLVFGGRYERAIEMLLHCEDEGGKAMAGTVAALSAVTGGGGGGGAGGGGLPPALQQYYDKLILRLEDTYYSVMLRHLALGDWGDVLEEEALPLRERLAIALQFLDDAALTRYLRQLAESASTRGNPDGILVTGIGGGGRGVELLQAYVDRTGDVQSAALLAASVGGRVDGRVGRWVESYRDLLDGWRLFYHRVQFDVDRGVMAVADGSGQREEGEGYVEGKREKREGNVPRQVLLRCNYCNKAMSAPPGAHATGRDTACPHCGRPLPRCSVCLMYLSILPDPTRDGIHAHHNAAAKDTLDDAIVFCQTCRHGGHASHVMEWFYGEDGEGEESFGWDVLLLLAFPM